MKRATAGRNHTKTVVAVQEVRACLEEGLKDIC